MYLLSLISNAISGCILNNRSTYIIPTARTCVPNYSDKMDGYLFGPCNSTLPCDTVLQACRFAKYRHRYCEYRDAHFCSLQMKGAYVNYYQVECG